MWSDAAKELSKFTEAVLTALDTDGYPLSVRVRARDFDPATGTLAVSLPADLHAAEGQANLLCHYHDDKLWRLDSTQVKGCLRRRDDGWVFAAEHFTPKSRWHMVSFLRRIHTSGQKYLDRRGLRRPAVNWAALSDIRRRAAK